MGIDQCVPRWDITSDVVNTQQRRRVSLTATGTFNLAPRDIWRLLTLPEADSIFRVEQRQVLHHEPHGKTEEKVVFLAPVRVLFWKTWARTKVQQAVDASDPQLLRVTFSLISSSMMSHLTGSWKMQQLEPPGVAGQPPRTRVTYTFEMWPKGVPPALHFMPGLVEAVKAAVRREAAQLFDKMQFVADKIGPGVSLPAALRAAAGEVAESGGSFKQLQLSLSSRTASNGSSDSCSTHDSIKSGQVAPAALQYA